MEYRTIGRTDIKVSSICMGCWAIVGDQTWGPQDEQDAVAAIEASLEAGVTLFDTAPAYGNGKSERMLGQVLKPHRQRVVIATKLSQEHMRKADAIAACETSLRNLRTDCIDIYQLHWANREVPFEKTVEALDKLLQQGKIRVVGVSNFGPRDLADFLSLCRAEADQVACSLLMRAAEFELVPVCVKHGVSVLTYSPLAEGLLTGKFGNADEVPAGRARTRHFSSRRERTRHTEEGAEAETFRAIGRVREIASGLGLSMGQVALAWLLRQPAVTSVVAGCRNARQARENAAAAEADLPVEVIGELNDATEALKQKLGPNLDPWQTDSRVR